MPLKVTLKLALANRQPLIKANPTQVQQILMNLVINAAEAIGDKAGIIQISTGSTMLTPETGTNPSLAGVEPGEYVYVEVKGTGCGMDAGAVAKIFDPFFSTKFTGRGLGLAAVSGIVRSNHGAITVLSAVGHGSILRVLFPADPSAIDEKRSPVAAGQDLHGTGTVLLVDDEPSVLRTARVALQRFGDSVLEAEKTVFFSLPSGTATLGRLN